MHVQQWLRCLSVCLLSHISSLGLLFVVKTLPHTQWARKVKKFVVFSLKLLRYRDRALPPLNGHTYGQPFFLQMTHMRKSLPVHPVEHISASFTTSSPFGNRLKSKGLKLHTSLTPFEHLKLVDASYMRFYT